MRDIKFRAWNNTLNEMYYNVQNHINNDWAFGYIVKNKELWSLMQYTGLKDKNGKDAFESDIAKDRYNQTFVIDWNYTLLSQLEDIEFEVIGNIYENPELLES